MDSLHARLNSAENRLTNTYLLRKWEKQLLKEYGCDQPGGPFPHSDTGCDPKGLNNEYNREGKTL